MSHRRPGRARPPVFGQSLPDRLSLPDRFGLVSHDLHQLFADRLPAPCTLGTLWFFETLGDYQGNLNSGSRSVRAVRYFSTAASKTAALTFEAVVRVTAFGIHLLQRSISLWSQTRGRKICEKSEKLVGCTLSVVRRMSIYGGVSRRSVAQTIRASLRDSVLRNRQCTYRRASQAAKHFRICNQP